MFKRYRHPAKLRLSRFFKQTTLNLELLPIYTLTMPRKRKIVPPEERFVFIDDEELENKKKSFQNKNTTKADLKAHHKFTQYLELKGLQTEYRLMTESELDKILSKLWFEVRTQEGDRYKASSLGSLCYGINHNLHEQDHEFDIVRDSSFKQSRKDFETAGK